MSDITTGNDDDFWEQWEKMTLHDQGMWALQVAAKLKSIRSWVKSIQEKINASPIALNFRDEIDFCAMRARMDLHDLDILRASVPVLETKKETP